MKTDLTTAGSFAQTNALAKGEVKRNLPRPILGKLPPTPNPDPDYKIDLSSKSPSASVPPIPSMPIPSLPDLPTSAKPDQVLDLAKDNIKDEVKAKVEDIKKSEVKDGTIKRPALFFVKGLDIFLSPSNSERGYAGVGKMAEAIEGSRIYGWDQKEEVIKEIKKIHPDYPVILVGHSLGGDTVVEIADELDSLEANFRSVDLLVTIDAVGFSHDIVPQNVKKHLNVFGEKSLLLSDGPHVARREEKTSVRNILSPHDHTDIDDDREVQFEIINMIQNTLKEAKL